MSPRELRAFRESIGLNRREFARRLFISQPTLERWERGQGRPREVHLHILGRMRQHLTAGHPDAYFQYDVASGLPPSELLRDEKRLVIETLRGMGVMLLEERHSEDGGDWLLRFGVGWAAGEQTDLVLVCEGSDRPERPAIDFGLEVADGRVDDRHVAEALREICFNHALSWKLARSGGERCAIELRQRTFRTACNPETIRHVLGNYHSCWRRLKEALLQARSAVEGVNT